MKINVLFIDCDNENSDRGILEKFHSDMKEYTYLTWETFSSTEERPKFRALIPLDKTIQYTKDVKKSVAHIFEEYSDQKASWYFAPDALHLRTLHFNKGTLFPSEHITSFAEKLKRDREMTEAMFERIARARAKDADYKRNEDGWRNFESVKYCLGGLTKGERDQSISKACYAMANRGYRDKIPEFLDELIVPQEFKNKFKNKYR